MASSSESRLSRQVTEVFGDDDTVDRELDVIHKKTPNISEQSSAWCRQSVDTHHWSGASDAGSSSDATLAGRPSCVPSTSRLPRPHIQAHLPFYTMCQQPVDPTARDWNSEFQHRWVWRVNRDAYNVDHQDELQGLLVQYESYSLELVKSFIADKERSGAALPANNSCVRLGNVVLQVWYDVKLAQNMQRCFSAAMECRPPHLRFPLTATFRYLHVAISVQALIPLRAGKVPEYRGDGLPDPVVNLPLCEYLHVLQCATNVKPPTPTAARTDKILGVEVYEGLDAALYLFNCIGLFPTMQAATSGSEVTLPLRRWHHMASHEARSWSEQPALGLYAMAGPTVYRVLSPVLQEPTNHRHDHLVKRLHEQGINVCLLGSLAQWLLQIPKDEQESDLDALLRLIAIEVLARTMREVMCTQMTHDATPITLQAVNTYLMRIMASVVDSPAKRFRDGLQGLIEKKFIFDASTSPEAVMEYLQATIQDFPSSVTQRLCQLTRTSTARGAVAQVSCKPSNHNASVIVSPQWEQLRVQIARDAEDMANSSPAFRYAYLLPLQEVQCYRAGRLDSAWACAKKRLDYWSSDLRARFMTAHACSNAALCAALCGRAHAAEHLSRTATHTLQHTPMYLTETPHTAAASLAVVGTSAAGVNTVKTAPSRYGVFVYGLTRARLTQGYVRCLAKDYFAAEQSFDAALSTPEVLGQWRLPYLAQMRLEAIVGLFEVATHGSEEYINRFARVWKETCETLPPTLLGAHVHELLGSLYAERRLYHLAAAQFWECVDIRETIMGDDSPEVAQTLNKLGLLYYNWDPVRCGLYCSCILHRAEAIMASVHGLYSAPHMAISENIIALFIRRGQYVEASQRLYTLQHLPPRYANRLPRDHPTTIRLVELEGRLRSAFTPWAALIIQRCWCQYRARLLVRKVLEDSARVLQRAGRGLMIRRTLALISTQRATMTDVVLMEMMMSVLTASDDLVRMSSRFSRQTRDWNMEYQTCRLLCDWSTAKSITGTVAQLDALRAEFTQRATDFARHRDERLSASHALQGGDAVPVAAATFVKDNIFFRPVAKHDRLAALQNLVYQHFSRSLFSAVTSPLSTIVSLPHCDYFAIALPPLHSDPEYVIMSDGHPGPLATATSESFLHELVDAYHNAGLTSMNADRVQGLECIRGQDGLFYVTNGLGLVNNLLFANHSRPGGDPQKAGVISVVDPGITALPEQDDWVASPSLPRRVLNLMVAGKLEEATAAIEAYAMSSVIRTRAQKIFCSCMLEVVQSSKSDDVSSLEVAYLRAASAMEECGAYFLATIVGLSAARMLCARDAFKSAIPFLLRNVHLLRRKLRLHAYFSAYLILDNTMLLLTASTGCKKPVDSATLDLIIPTLDLAQPSCLFFTALERLIHYCHLNGRTNVAEDLQNLRTVRSKQLSEPLRKHLVQALLKSSEECAERSALQESVPYLTASIHLCSLQGGGRNTSSVELGVLYSHYGSVLTMLNDLFAARKSLSKAFSILSKTCAANSPELLTLYKHHRVLKARLRDNATLVIRRAVRRWREKRRLDANMARDHPEEFSKLQNVRVLRRINRLVVSEATSRVLVLEAQTESWYLLLRKQLRMRNEAMLRQTYGTRVQIHVDKLASAREDLVELALASKATIGEYGMKMQRHMCATMLETAYRLQRRVIIQEWTAACAQVKMWHVEHVDVVIRSEFLRAYQRYLHRCVSAEEGMWRRAIAQNQIRTKKLMGRYIVKKLRQRPRNPPGDHRAIELEESRMREKILADEAQAFNEIGDVFIFGPEVLLDDDDW